MTWSSIEFLLVVLERGVYVGEGIACAAARVTTSTTNAARKVAEVLFDCHGAFEGFVLDD